MGSELWQRLNGVAPGEEANGRNVTALRQALTEDPVVRALAQDAAIAQAQVASLEIQREQLYRQLMSLRDNADGLSADVDALGGWGSMMGWYASFLFLDFFLDFLDFFLEFLFRAVGRCRHPGDV